MKRVYLALAVVGAVVPYYFFVSFLLEYGLDVPLLLAQLLANDVSTFFAADLVITAVILLLFFRQESQRLHIGHWWIYALATLLVGPSFALPLFLSVRHSRLASTNVAA